MKIGVKRAQKQHCLENDDSGGSSIAMDMRTCCRHDAVLHSYACARTFAAALWWVHIITSSINNHEKQTKKTRENIYSDKKDTIAKINKQKETEVRKTELNTPKTKQT